MKINSVYISAFGGIKDLKLDFSDGFNLIYGTNEQGKSTVMAFIKMMFYGSDRGSSQISKNMRKKYTPWDGSAMAGSVDFEFLGKNYRLERQFRSSNSTDKLTLFDLDFGESQTVSGDIGTKFFGLSAAAFERSFFIGQSLFPDSDSAAEGEINSKLSNIAVTGDEDVSYEKVHSKLEKAKLSLMSKSGRTGEYDKNLKLCAELKERIEKAQNAEASLEIKKKEILALQNENLSIAEKAKKLKAIIDSEQDIRNREKLEEYLKLKDDLDTLNAKLRLSDGSLIDEMFLRKLQFCISKADAANSKAEAKLKEKGRIENAINSALNPPKDASKENAQRLSEEISAIEKEYEKTENQISALSVNLNECENHSGSKGSGKSIALLISGGLLFIAAVVLFLMNQVLLSTLPLVAGIGLIIGFAFSKNSQKKLIETQNVLKEKISALKQKSSSLNTEAEGKKLKLEAINSALNSSAAILMNQREMLKEAIAELTELEALAKAENEALFTLFSSYKEAQSLDEILNSIDEISALASKQKELKQHLSIIARDLNSISYEEAAEKLKEIESQNNTVCENFEELKKEYEQLTDALNHNNSRIATISTEAKISLSNTENTEALKSEFKSLMQKTLKQKEFCDIADIAMQTLSESFIEIRKSYGSVLEKNAGEIFSKLSGGKYSSMSISNSFDINVMEKDVFGSRQVDYLSSGGADQAYLSLRLALSRLICADKENLPIFLDDSLTQYDDTRVKQALSFLKSFAEAHQTIMFTCHNSICEMGKEMAIEIKNLK